jgi:hypothetical protein
MNVMLRGSILYVLLFKRSGITKRIEENYLRKILKTTKGCPITQLYLEVGHYPARFEIKR